MFKLNRRSFLKITLLVGYVLFFNKDLLNAEEKKVYNKDLFTEANNWIVKINQKETVLKVTTNKKKISNSKKIKNKILNIFK